MTEFGITLEERGRRLIFWGKRPEDAVRVLKAYEASDAPRPAPVVKQPPPKPNPEPQAVPPAPAPVVKQPRLKPAPKPVEAPPAPEPAPTGPSEAEPHGQAGNEEPDMDRIVEYILSRPGDMEHSLPDMAMDMTGHRIPQGPLYMRWHRSLQKAHKRLEKQKGIRFEKGGTNRLRIYRVQEVPIN